MDRSPARLYLTLGKQAGIHVAHLLGGSLIKSEEAGWGRQTIDIYGAGAITLVALPHLSRYKVFGGGRTAAAELLAQTARGAGL